MKISAGDGYKPLLNGILPSSQLVTLCGLLVLINLSVIWISVKECHSALFVLPILLMGVLFKLVWDQSNRLGSLLVVLLTLAVFGVLYTTLAETRRQQELRLVYNILQVNSHPKDHTAPDNTAAAGGLNIFFVETNLNKQVLTNRELCAIESAARHNPDARVHVYTVRAEMTGPKGEHDLLRSYPNVARMRLVPTELFNSTPLMAWWLQGDWAKSPHLYAHISDAARLALLWRHGGFYSDLDTITLKSLRPVAAHPSVGHMVEMGQDSLGNGVMSFERAHPLLRRIMSSFGREYDPFAWGNTGPLLVERELKNYCRTDSIYQSQLIDQATFEQLTTRASEPKWQDFRDSNQTTRCDVLIYPSSFYYPFNYREDIDELFAPNSRLNVSKLINSFSVHFYGKFSAKLEVHVGDNSLYEYLAMTHCPLVYAAVKTTKATFN